MSYDDAVSETLTIAYTGEGLNDGSIDAEDFASSMMALGGLFKVANETLNPNGPKVSVRIRATSKGSFEVTLDLAMSFVRQMTTLLNSDGANGLSNLLTILGFVSGGGGTLVGLFQLIKLLAGNKPDCATVSEDGLVTLVINEQTVTTRREVIKLVETQEVRTMVTKFVRPLHGDEIESIEVRGSANSQPIVIATRENLPALEADFATDNDGDPVVESVYDVALQIISPSFKDGTKWRFSDGDSVFYANVVDQAFLADVDEHRSTFGKDDVLVSRLRRRQTRGPNGKLTSEYTVEEVIEHRPARRQLSLLALAEKASREGE